MVLRQVFMRNTKKVEEDGSVTMRGEEFIRRQKDNLIKANVLGDAGDNARAVVCVDKEGNVAIVVDGAPADQEQTNDASVQLWQRNVAKTIWKTLGFTSDFSIEDSDKFRAFKYDARTGMLDTETGFVHAKGAGNVKAGSPHQAWSFLSPTTGFHVASNITDASVQVEAPFKPRTLPDTTLRASGGVFWGVDGKCSGVHPVMLRDYSDARQTVDVRNIVTIYASSPHSPELSLDAIIEDAKTDPEATKVPVHYKNPVILQLVQAAETGHDISDLFSSKKKQTDKNVVYVSVGALNKLKQQQQQQQQQHKQ